MEVLSLSIREPGVLSAIEALEGALSDNSDYSQAYGDLKRVARNQLVPKKPRGLFT